MATDQGVLRRTQMAGLLRSLAWNADRRQGSIRLFEVGVVFSVPDPGRVVTERAGPGGAQQAMLPDERELVSAIFATEGDDALTAVAAFDALVEELGLTGVRMRAPGPGRILPGLHPTRSAELVSGPTDAVIGAVGEVDPAVVTAFGAGTQRVGWLEVDLGLLLDGTAVARRSELSRPVSRFPSSDVDLALVLDDAVPADDVARVLGDAGGELLESVTHFDVYRGPGVAPGRRSLGFRLRFCALDRTLTDREVGELRTRCVGAAERELGAVLR
jgi:phenylalanyl-tRNA synthetase beta chain